ncbi:MAG: DNA translocase FtsK, partial [Clostridia bacterium]|nr:DNA translocase FtsK [Clostridia bacterium]
ITSDVCAVYDPDVIEQIEKDEGEYQPDGEDPGDCDELLADCIDMAITSGQISTSLLQRRFRIGYNRAGSIIDQMEARGIISGLDGNKPRQVLITREQYNEMLMK